MANETNKTTEILEFKVEQGSAITELEKTKKSIIGLKEEQKQLNDAYKKGHITQEELAKELVRVETLLKKQSSEYNTLTKKVTGVQTETSKLIASNQKLAQSIKDSASQINIAGVNVGQLTDKIKSLANPVTATVAVVSALGAAYARSTIGAKDLAFAQAQLSNSITIVTNDLARLVSSSEDGQGALTKAADFTVRNVTKVFGPAGEILSAYLNKVADKAQEAALATEKFEDLQREEIEIRGKISERLADNQELLTLIGDEQTKQNEKAEAFSTIIGNLRVNQKELVNILEQQRDEIQKQLDADQENEDLQTAVLQKNREIEKAKSDTEKRIQGILRMEDNVKDANEKQLKAEREKTAELERQITLAKFERERANQLNPQKTLQEQITAEFETQKTITKNRVDLEKSANSEIAKSYEAFSKKVEDANNEQAKSNNKLSDSTDAQRDSLRLFSSEAARLYQTINRDNKYFAAAQLAVDAGLTLSGIERQSAGLDPKVAGVYRAAAILSAGASLAQAAKLIGTTSPDISALGPSFTATSGQQYVIQNGQAVPLEDAQRKAQRKQQIASDVGTVTSAVTTGAAIGSVVPGLGTAAGAVAGLLVGAGILLVRRIRERRARRRGYAEGGWTGPGEMNDVVGLVHADEYVVPKNIKNTQAAQPHLKALEQMRLRGYASGGYTPVTPSSDIAAVIAAIQNLQVYAAITDINKAEKRQATKMAIVTR